MTSNGRARVLAQLTGRTIRGIASICSAHPLVIEAALRRCKAEDAPVLIEATCNQVNQEGCYTGMTPADFRRFVEEIAARVRFPLERVILGGDLAFSLIHREASVADRKACPHPALSRGGPRARVTGYCARRGACDRIRKLAHPLVRPPRRAITRHPRPRPPGRGLG